MADAWRLQDSPLGCSTSALLEPRGEIYAPPARHSRRPAPAARHPSRGLLLPTTEVLIQEGELLLHAGGGEGEENSHGDPLD